MLALINSTCHSACAKIKHVISLSKVSCRECAIVETLIQNISEACRRHSCGRNSHFNVRKVGATRRQLNFFGRYLRNCQWKQYHIWQSCFDGTVGSKVASLGATVGVNFCPSVASAEKLYSLIISFRFFCPLALFSRLALGYLAVHIAAILTTGVIPGCPTLEIGIRFLQRLTMIFKPLHEVIEVFLLFGR